MLSIGKLGKGQERYYLGKVAEGAEDYYSGEGEEAGEWIGERGEGEARGGRAAARLARAVRGLRPAVDRHLPGPHLARPVGAHPRDLPPRYGAMGDPVLPRLPLGLDRAAGRAGVHPPP